MILTSTVALAVLGTTMPQIPGPDPRIPLEPVPHKRQLAWHEMEYYAFVHFGPNTFTGKEWGDGKENPNVYDPTQLDPKQWARVFKQAGMKGVIITAKHHDGFCLWPSKQSNHTVANSKNPTDVLKALSEACKAEGLKFGVYVSPWDRNHPLYGTPEYNAAYVETLKEVLGNYGPVFEMWFDGANGEGPNGKKQVYDWAAFHETVRKFQPNAVMFSDAGPDIRWVGNEAGIASDPHWGNLNRNRYVPGTPLYKELGEGQREGNFYVPAECDVSIRPGWFYRSSEDAKVKTPAELEELYYASVGRGSNLLLNVPPDPRGLIADPDIKSLMGLKEILDKTFKRNLAKEAKVEAVGTLEDVKEKPLSNPKSVIDGKQGSYWIAKDTVRGELILKFPTPVLADVLEIREHLPLGQRVAAFRVQVNPSSAAGEESLTIEGKTIGNRRLLRFEPRRVSEIRIAFIDGRGAPAISEVGLYASPRTLGN